MSAAATTIARLSIYGPVFRQQPQLGHDSLAVRLAGVYALAALANDWHGAGDDAQTQVCVDVLCAYLRLAYDPKSAKATAGEQQVRWTVIKVIRDHLQDTRAVSVST